MKNEKIPYKIYLSENEMPTVWYNLSRHKKEAGTALEPREPMTAELSGVFCEDLVAQKLDNHTAYFEIPEEIRDFYNRKKGADSGAFFQFLNSL